MRVRKSFCLAAATVLATCAAAQNKSADSFEDNFRDPDLKAVWAARATLPPDLRYTRKEVPKSQNAYALLLPVLEKHPFIKSTKELADGVRTKNRVVASKFEKVIEASPIVPLLTKAAALLEYQREPSPANFLKAKFDLMEKRPVYLRIDWLRLVNLKMILGKQDEAGVMLGQMNRLFRKILTSDETVDRLGLAELDCWATDRVICQYAQQRDVTPAQLEALLPTFRTPESIKNGCKAMLVRDLNCGQVPYAVKTTEDMKRPVAKDDEKNLRRLPHAYDQAATIDMMVRIARFQKKALEAPYLPPSATLERDFDSITAPAWFDPGQNSARKGQDEALRKVTNPVGREVASVYAGVLRHYRTDVFRAMADAAATRLFVALEIYYKQHKSLPDRLSDLPQVATSPGLTIDPTTGKEFGYSKGDKRIWIAPSDVVLTRDDGKPGLDYRIN